MLLWIHTSQSGVHVKDGGERWNTDVLRPVMVAALTPKKRASMAAIFLAGYIRIMPTMLKATIYASKKRRASEGTPDDRLSWRVRSHSAI